MSLKDLVGVEDAMKSRIISSSPKYFSVENCVPNPLIQDNFWIRIAAGLMIFVFGGLVYGGFFR